MCPTPTRRPTLLGTLPLALVTAALAGAVPALARTSVGVSLNFGFPVEGGFVGIDVGHGAYGSPWHGGRPWGPAYYGPRYYAPRYYGPQYYGPRYYGPAYVPWGVWVAPPPVVWVPAPPVAVEPASVPATRPDPVIYPRHGQNAQQTEYDRQQCNRWATTQQAAMLDASVFQRAVEACMDGRGYSIR